MSMMSKLTGLNEGLLSIAAVANELEKLPVNPSRVGAMLSTGVAVNSGKNGDVASIRSQN